MVEMNKKKPNFVVEKFAIKEQCDWLKGAGVEGSSGVDIGCWWFSVVELLFWFDVVC